MNSYKEKKDDTLVEMTLLGNEKAYEELVTRHESSVKGTAYKVTGNQFSAEDAAQDAFISAWVNLDSLQNREKFGAWVCSIAKNCARNLVCHYASAVADISLNLLENTDLFASDASGLLEQLELSEFSARERDEKLRSAVEALNDKIRQTVQLHYFEGLSVAQIAEKLSLPLGTVKWRLSEGRKQLRKEYGIMEKTYDENESLVARVMRQVEELKLWRLKNDRTGFEKDYRAVLSNVEALGDSKEKDHMLADVLLRGYWWLDTEKNKEMLVKIKAAAEKSHNEDVMQSVMAVESKEYRGQKKIDYMRNTQIPYLEEHNFVKAVGYVWFWMGYEYLEKGHYEKGMEAYQRVLELLTPMDVYYANALAAIHSEKKKKEAGVSERKAFIRATGEVYRYIGDCLYFWEQPGYSKGMVGDQNGSLFWNCSHCDGAIFDSNMKVGEARESSDKKVKLYLKEKGVTVATSSERFEDCSVYVWEGNAFSFKYVETAFCPNVGMIRQIIKKDDDEVVEWQLSDYVIRGGEGLMPFAQGNLWKYACLNQEEGEICSRENVFEVTGYEDNRAVVASYSFAYVKGYDESSWYGNMLWARREYCHETEEIVYDMDIPLRRAAQLAVTTRQKRHTAIASDVMRRITRTDPIANPDYTEKGRWNFFEYDRVEKNDHKTVLKDGSFNCSFEWKDMGACGDSGRPVLHNFLYDMLNQAAGCIWSDEWVGGYHWECDREYDYRQKIHLILDVQDGQIVDTPAGRFENCRQISLNIIGLSGGWHYRGGKKNYWFAPNVGIVKYESPYKNETLMSEWILTEFSGEGAGYFPVSDGFFRRYEAVGLTNGWHAWVEYTFDEDETGMIMFRNALGTQDRANYEADLAEKKRKQEESKK